MLYSLHVLLCFNIRQLIDCGFTLDEIYGVIKRKAFNEAENTYVTFYKP